MQSLPARILVLILGLVALVPVCALLGYGIGYLVSLNLYSAVLHPDTYVHDRELFAGIIGILFIGGALYVLSAVYVLFRFVRALRRDRRPPA
ncbi:hypothetical protein [Paracoccus sp. KR1-242]|uniref:hypothetical protein n=1 Tax=Paracoccus sp. KR1-242 TaxID=3410028 RepID=UPI003C1031C6